VLIPAGSEPSYSAVWPVQILSGWPLLIALVNGPSSVTLEFGGSVPVSWSCGATAMPAPCRPSSGQLCASTVGELASRTSVAAVKYAHGWVVGPAAGRRA
jgi:hypothetical protein